MGRRCRLVIFSVLMCHCISGQTVSRPAFLSFTPADTFHTGRFWTATGVTAGLYAGTVIALNAAWYQQFPRTGFHFFDDHREWRGMDKAGHLYTGYFESLWSYKLARWTGMRERPAMWTGAAMGFVFQTTVEVLDGYSAEWGFSLTDAGFNILGIGAFMAQQELWGEQRVALKVSSTPNNYPNLGVISTDGNGFTSLDERADDLFGKHYPERFIKDYNAQTVWASVNVASFLNPDSRWPKWLNIAVGYGAENMYGGYANAWTDDDGAEYVLSEDAFPRYSQYYISPDIDFTQIPSRSAFVRTFLGMLNVFKMPGPALEYNRVDGFEVRLMW